MQALRLSERKKAYYYHSVKPLSKQLKGITFFVKHTAKKDENFLMFMRKFPEPPMITFQFEKWALWFCSLPDFPGKLCHECFILEDDDPSPHLWALALSSPRKAELLKLEWAYPSIPSLVLHGARNLLLFFFSNKLLSGSYAGGPQTSLSEIVEGLNLQSSALYICFLVWLSNDKVARCHHTMRQSYHRPWLHYLVHPFLQPAMKSFELP